MGEKNQHIELERGSRITIDLAEDSDGRETVLNLKAGEMITIQTPGGDWKMLVDELYPTRLTVARTTITESSRTDPSIHDPHGMIVIPVSANSVSLCPRRRDQ